jgi:ADP-ribose pyrophosphatase
MSKQIKPPLDDDTHWKRLSRKVLFEHPRITLIEDEVELPDGNKVPYLLFGMDTRNVTVICVRDDEILLQREYSYPLDKVIYQFPGGKMEIGESPVDAGRRELIEESKLDPKKLSEIGWYYVNNRRSNAKMYVVVARECKICDSLAGDPEENITSEWIPIAQFEEMISNGQIVNYSVLAAWALYKSKQ